MAGLLVPLSDEREMTRAMFLVHVLMVLLTLALLAYGFATIRRRGLFATAALVAGLLLLVLDAGALLAHRGHPPHPSVVESGIQGTRNYRMIEALAPSGQEMLLNASLYPVLFFSPQDQDTGLRRIAAAYAAIAGTKRPLMLVGTLYPTSSARVALKDTSAYLQRAVVAAPWAVQIGPAREYVQRTPELVWVDPEGHTQRAIGVSAILAHLERVSALSGPHAARPQKTKRKGK